MEPQAVSQPVKNVDQISEIPKPKSANHAEMHESIGITSTVQNEQNEKAETLPPVKSQNDTPTKNKLNLTIDIPKEESPVMNNAESSSESKEQTPAEYDVKFEVKIFFFLSITLIVVLFYH